jgi:putative alpha-1,2-mannosidase
VGQAAFAALTLIVAAIYLSHAARGTGWDSGTRKMMLSGAKHKNIKALAVLRGSAVSRGLLITLFTAHCSLFTVSAQQTPDYTHWVNPFIGTGGHGHTFPGATTPFGMVQLSPDTRGADWDGSSGYHYSDDVIYGFSHTHLSGTGIPDYCDILFLPVQSRTGKVAEPTDRSVSHSASRFSHANEHAEPGYYSVKLDDDDIFAELTSTPRVGVHRYTFSKTETANILVDLNWRDKVLDSKYTVTKSGRIEGYRRSSSWAKDQVIYFVAEFSKTSRGYVYGKDSASYGHIPVAVVFDVKAGEQILVKVALSPVSIEGARKNLAAEMPGWDFDKVRADAKAAWNKELSKIEVSGGTDAQTTTFYTALYHTMIQPNIFEDVDGSYRGHDGKIHNIYGNADTLVRSEGRRGPNAPRSDQPRGGGTGPPEEPSIADKSVRVPYHEYTVFSLWDTFRAAHPLYTIIDQKRTVDFINTFIRQYEQGGRLPVWELAGNETDCMIGYHAVSVIADAMAKGITGFDYEKAYEAAKHSAELDRDGLAAYKKRGYISMEDTNESVSKTLEYAYDDWCIAQMADIMGKRYEDYLLHTNKKLASDLPEREYAADYQRYSKRARNFENLFDPSTGFMRPRQNGGFLRPFAPNEVTFNYTEGNAWVYTFFVPQDISRLVELMGGREAFVRKLDDLFTTSDKLGGREQPDITGLIGQYAHGNEPSHHIAYLYDYAGQPWKTQRIVRHIMDEFYKPEPDGLIGNEDCGQMSAWYVLSASGIYEVTPGSGIYAFGTPLFKKLKYNLENGKSFTITASNVSTANTYISSVRLNGQNYTKAFISYEDMMKGGVLQFEMRDTPAKNAFSEFPTSSIDGVSTAVPVIDGERIFKDKTIVTMRKMNPDAMMFYTTDGNTPTQSSKIYLEPIELKATATVKAFAYFSPENESPVVEAVFRKRPNDWAVKIDSKYNRQYTGGGDEGLIDGIRGTTSFASGEWQGYQAQDFVATIDLKRPTTFSEVGGGFLQNAGSWIWMPTHIEFDVSQNGVNFTRVADIKTDVAVTDMESKIRDYTAKISPTTARYVRVHAYNLGKIPSWHPGAGSDAFIFVDEIWVK